MTIRRLPPYVSFTTFESFLDSLRASGVPNRIQRKGKIMASKSGSSQAALLSAIHYLGLIDDAEQSTPLLEELAMAKGSKREEVLRKVVTKSYTRIFNSDLKLERATTEEMSELFEMEGVTGEDTIRKCVTFFCLAAKASGIKLSPYIKPYAGKRRSKKTFNASETAPNQLDGGVEQIDVERWESLLAKFPEFDTTWSPARVDTWLNAFERLARICDNSNRPVIQNKLAN